MQFTLRILEPPMWTSSQMIEFADIMASFTRPMEIGATPASFLWLLPLVAAISVVYKAVKVPKVNSLHFVRECLLVFLVIVVFMIMVAIGLHVLLWFILE